MNGGREAGGAGFDGFSSGSGGAGDGGFDGFSSGAGDAGDGGFDGFSSGAGDGGDAGFDGFSSPEAALRARAQAARLLYPELRELPDEDAVAVVLGGGMLGAYAGFRARETIRLRQENDLLRRNQDNLRRAPVRGVAGGNPQTRGRDLFEQGFDEDGW